MKDEPDKGKKPQRGRLRRRLLKAFLGIVALCLLGLLAAFLFLRSESGLSYALGKAKGALAQKGLALSYSSAEGPLPSRLRLKDVSLSDPQGVFLTMGTLELELSPSRLLSRTVEVGLLSVGSLDLRRPPSLPPSEGKPKGGGFPGLPVSVTVRLRVSDSKILSSLQGEGNESVLDLSGDLAYLRGGGLTFDLSGLWAPPGGEGLRLSSRLGEGSLFLDLSLTLAEGGPLEWLEGDLGLPWGEPRLALKAEGPLEGLRGSLSVTDLAPPGRAESGEGDQGQTDQGKGDQGEGGQGEGGQGPINQGQGDQGPIDQGPIDQGPINQGLIDQGQGDPVPADSQDAPFGISGAFALASEEGTTFHGLLGDPGLAKSLSLTLQSSHGFPLPKGLGALAGGSPSLSLSLRREGDGSFAGTLGLVTGALEAELSPVSLSLGGGKAELGLAGIFAIARPAPPAGDGPPPGPPGQAGGPPPPAVPLPPAQSGQGRPAKASAQPDGPRPPQGAGAGQGDGPAAPRGPLKGALALKMSMGDGRIAVPGLTLSGEGLKLSLSGLYGGGGGSSGLELALSLKKGEGFSSLIPGLPKGIASDAELRLSAKYDGAARAIEGGRLSLSLGDLGGLAPGLSGPLDLSLEAEGPVLRRLEARLSASSPGLTRESPWGPLAFLSPKLDLTAALSDLGAGPGIEGRIGLSAKAGDGSPLVSLRADPRLGFGDGLFEGSLGELVFSGLGADLKAQRLSVRLADGAPPELSGELGLRVSSYEGLRRLLGLELKGEPLSLALAFSRDQGLQLASGSLRNDSLAAGPAKASKTSADFSLGDPFGRPALSLALTTGPGAVPGLQWSKGEAMVSPPEGDGGASRISLAFKGPGGGELLTLKGSYSPEEGALDLASLAFAVPKLGERLTLLSPARITLGPPPPAGAPPEPGTVADPGAGAEPGAGADPGAGGDARADAAPRGGPPAPRAVEISGLNLSLGKARLSLSGRLNPLDASLELRDLPFSALKAVTEAQLPEGAVSLKASYAQGRGGAVSLTADPTLRRESGPPLALKVELKGDIAPGGPLRGEGRVALPGPAGRDPVSLRYQVPLKASGPYPLPDGQGPLSASLDWSGDIGALWGLLALPDRSLRGESQIHLSVAGSLARPVPEAEVFLANSRYDDDLLSLHLSGINLAARADSSGERIRVLADATDGGGGTLALEGDVILGARPSVDARGQLRSLSPFHRDDFSATLSALFSIRGPLSDLRISTKAVVESLEVNLASSIGGPSVTTISIDQGFQASSAGPALDVSVSIPGGAYIRGRGLDSEWKGEIRVGGTAGAPLLNGNLNPIRGFFTLLGKEFVFSGGGITFRDSRRLNPGLDIELHRNVTNLTAIVRVEGTLDSPRLRFESNPPYPQDEVLAQVLFGKPASELSRFETIQLANSLRELAGVGSKVPNPLATMRDALGLSVLRIGEASTGSDRHLEGNEFRDNLGLDDEESRKGDTAPTIEAGKYLSDNIYVGVDQNLVDNSTGVRVEIELSPSMNLVSRTSDTSSRVGVGWKHDY